VQCDRLLCRYEVATALLRDAGKELCRFYLFQDPWFYRQVLYILTPKTRTNCRRHAADDECCAVRNVDRNPIRRLGAPGRWRDGMAELRELIPGRSNGVICDVDDDVNVEGGTVG
jgi:hypothetical protein